jgi:hypothetical protein
MDSISNCTEETPIAHERAYEQSRQNRSAQGLEQRYFIVAALLSTSVKTYGGSHCVDDTITWK